MGRFIKQILLQLMVSGLSADRDKGVDDRQVRSGIKSLGREIVLGFEDKPTSSAYACFRVYFTGTYLKEDPLCREFVENECVNIWIGNDTHLVQNTPRDGNEFNWIMAHKDAEDIKESWFQPDDMNEARRLVRDCDTRIAAAVDKTEKCLDWKICYRDPIPLWTSRSHKIALLGDSCHPNLPTSAQGASQATESAAVLALCLKLAGKENIRLAVSSMSWHCCRSELKYALDESI
jgi:salicylate hydroxylase